ncbi:hypothetical protein PG993_013973 [Apiospora rasikravindrae]|uniref:DUF7587 domain-containing protein n=1 Tax=Apiospora rasikravindrae TaxID=990691 RepID=A0ABR1RS47_9PEZI
MQTPRETANVSVDELLGSYGLDPYHSHGSGGLLFGAGPAEDDSAADASGMTMTDPATEPLVDTTSSIYSVYEPGRETQPAPTDLQEGDYADYPHTQTREWQRFDSPLLNPDEQSLVTELDMSDAARQSRLDTNALPRFLFRGYSQRSGGGDPRLNQWDKIIPHFFLDKTSPVPEHTLRDFPRRDEVIDAHLTGNTTDPVIRQTPFSSWSQSIQVALRYAGGPDDGSSRIAILDTTRLRPWNEVHNPPLRWGSWEYMVYGPIEGECLYTFPRQNFTDLFRPDFSYSGNGSLALSRENPQTMPQTLKSARAAATLFARRPGWENERPAIVIYIVVLLIASWRHSHMNPPRDLLLANWDPSDIQAIVDELASELEAYQTYRPVGMVGPDPQRVALGYEWFFEALNMMRAIDDPEN